MGHQPDFLDLKVTRLSRSPFSLLGSYGAVEGPLKEKVTFTALADPEFCQLMSLSFLTVERVFRLVIA